MPSRKGDAAYFASVKAQFAHFEGIGLVEANPVTGSVLVMYNGEMKSVAAFAEEKALFRLGMSSRVASPMSHSLVRAFRDADGRIKRLTSNELDVPGIAFVTLLGFGIYEIGRGNFAAPAWYTVFWYALNIFLKSMPETVQGEN